MKKIQPIRGTKDTVFTLLVADGRTGPFFLVTTSQKVPSSDAIDENDGHVLVLPKQEKRSERMTLAYLEWAVAPEYWKQVM